MIDRLKLSFSILVALGFMVAVFAFIPLANIIGAAPVPPPYVPCTDTNDDVGGPEFHSLRPYQASPCNKELEELDLYCANDLITKEDITVGPSDAIPGTCTTQRDGSITGCKFSEDRTVGVEIDLTNAELPIVGNTQLVPNQVNDGNPQPTNFSWERRVNEYLSWWLQGASYKAEEELIDPAIVGVPQLLEEKIRENITFAGPIRKLYPKFIRQRLQSKQQRAASIGNDKHARHNQIYLCTQRGRQVPCRYDFVLGQYVYNSAPVSVERLKSGNPKNTPDFSFLNFTSTEDRLGLIFAQALLIDPIRGVNIQPGSSEGNQVIISKISFVPNVDTDLLYFAHMIESNELSDRLQSTYVPEILKKKKFATSIGEGMEVYNTYRCDLKDVRWNPGDDLFGELGPTSIGSITVPETGQQVTGESISGDVEYTADFECLYFPPRRDVSCYNNCTTVPGSPDWNSCTGLIPPPPIGQPYPDRTSCCDNICSNTQTCTKTALTATSVYTRTPMVQELWERTVEGPVSLMKRILPKIGASGMFNEWKDYPAVTSANYKSISGATILAGDPNANRPGSKAELFIPHLGGIKVFAMAMIQDTLRPKLLGSKYLESGLPPGSAPNCLLGTGLCSPTSLQPFFGSNSQAASGICKIESGGSGTVINSSCQKCLDGIDNDLDGLIDLADDDCDSNQGNWGTYLSGVATADYSVGLFQINLHPRTGRCPLAWKSTPLGLTPAEKLIYCEVGNQAELDKCVTNYTGVGISDPGVVNNINFAVNLQSSQGWCAWGAAQPQYCALCP